MDDVIYNSVSRDYRVLIITNTYNQAQYITDTLDGVAKQQTDFPFVHVVMDDASTDGEPDVILNWLNEHCDMANADYVDIPAANVILVKHKTNVNCHYAIYLLKQNLYGNSAEKTRLFQPWREHCKYEALCEGDDYWTYPLKLQTQAGFLDQNPDFVLNFHDVFQLDVKTGEKSPFNMPDVEQCTDASTIAKHNFMCTLSVVHRIIPQVYQDLTTFGFSIIGDYPRWLLLSQYGKFYRFTERWAVYRRGAGVWSAETNMLKRNLMHLLCVAKTYGYLSSDEQRQLLDIQIKGCFNCILDEYDSYVSSRDYKLGNLFLRPIRSLRRYLNHAIHLIRR